MTDSEHNAWLEAALANTLAGEPVENITISSNEIGIHDAYALQRELVGRLESHGGWGDVYGYKAALTAEPAQQAMGINEPIIGVLFEHAAYQADSATTVATDRLVLLETEVGFTLRKEITAPVAKDDVFDAIACCSGMIELASPISNNALQVLTLSRTTQPPTAALLEHQQRIPWTLMLTPYRSLSRVSMPSNKRFKPPWRVA